MAQDLENKYFIKRRFSDTWVDITTLFDGIKVLSVTGMNEIGEAQNVFTQQWIDSQEEDYLLAGETVVRANVDLTMTFIAGTRYSSNGSVDTQTVYNSFVSYVCNDGDFYIKSTYTGKSAHVVCLKGIKPTTERLHRGSSSYIIATATLHCINQPE